MTTVTQERFVSLGERVLGHAAVVPEQLAVVCEGGYLTYDALASRAIACAARLQRLGLKSGGEQRVAIIAGNSLDYVVVIVACQLAGVSIAPLPCLFAADSLARMLDDANATVVFYDEDYSDKALLAVRSAKSAAAMTTVEIGKRRDSDTANAGTLLDNWLGALPAPFVAVRIEAGWESDLIYSSGTTGLPKGISQNHRGRVAQSIGLAELGIADGVGVFHTVGLYSNFGMIATLLALWWGGTLHFMRKFSGIGLRDALMENTIDVVFVAPATLMRALETPSFEETARRKPCIKLCSGAPLARSLKKQTLSGWPGPLVDAYGQTETGALTWLRADSVPDDKLGSVGTPLPTTVLRILDEAGNVLPVGSEGEIAGHTPTLMSGYHGREDATEGAHWRDEEGRLFVRTGDVGRLDQDGYLWLCDRKKDMIISGGFNVYPADIERELQAHPAVREVAVVGAPSTRWGETPVAFLTLRDGHTADAVQIQAWVNARVGSVQRVAAVQIVEDLPRGSLGKILKRELRSRLEETAATWP